MKKTQFKNELKICSDTSLIKKKEKDAYSK